MVSMKLQPRGFTVIELLIVITVLLSASLLFFNQKNRIEATARDNQRKANINAIYHNLEKIYYPQHKHYPKQINSTTLPAVPEDTFSDPDGIVVNGNVTGDFGLTTTHSSYSYNPTNCNSEDQCQGYTLRASLENEKDYLKKSSQTAAKSDKDQD